MGCRTVYMIPLGIRVITEVNRFFIILFFKVFYLFIFREREGREKEEKIHRYVRDTSISRLSHAPKWRPSLQPGHVP